MKGVARIAEIASNQPEIKRPYRVWGYPFLPLLFVFINVAVFLNRIWDQPFKSLVGLVILCIGIPAFLYWKNKADKEV